MATVVLPLPVAPQSTTFFRAFTAADRKPLQSRAASSASSPASASGSAPSAAPVPWKVPLSRSESSDGA